MTKIETIRHVAARLRERRSRTGLASLGVGAGAATLVFLTTLAASLDEAARRGLDAMGARSLIVTTRAPASGRDAIPLTVDDGVALEHTVSAVERVSPMLRFRAPARCGARPAPVTVATVVPEEIRTFRRGIIAGRYLTELDVVRGHAVCVVGASVAERLACSVVGRDVMTFDRTACSVVGILDRSNTDLDESVHVPASFVERAMRHRVRGGVGLAVELKAGVDQEAAMAQIRRMIGRRHRARDASDEDVAIVRKTDLSDELTMVSGAATTVIVIVTLWSLVIAAIGIANAVLASVLERVPEIGLKRAVGATRVEIKREYLTEGALISGLGGTFDSVAGWAAVQLFCAHAGLPHVISTVAFGLAVVSALVLGILAAVGPATYASYLTPVDAIRMD